MNDRLLIVRALAQKAAETPDDEFDFEDMEDSFPLCAPARDPACAPHYEAACDSVCDPAPDDPPERADPRPPKIAPDVRALRTAERIARNREVQRRRYLELKAIRGHSRCLGFTGGSGTPPSYAGTAEWWWMHPGLLGTKRLVLLARLCRDGSATSRTLAPLIDGQLNDAINMLQGMEGASLVRRHRGHWLDRYPRPSGTMPERWEVTDDGRRYLWRAGLVTRRLLLDDWEWVPLRNDVNTDALRAIRRHVRSEFLRPVAMAVIHDMRTHRSRSIAQVRRRTGLDYNAVYRFLLGWRRQGWIRPDGTEPRVLYQRSSAQVAWAWTREGEMALLRHIDAMRRVLRASRYRPDRHDLAFPIDWNLRAEVDEDMAAAELDSQPP